MHYGRKVGNSSMRGAYLRFRFRIILETRNWKHCTIRTWNMSKLCIKNHLSLKDPIRRWETGVSLMGFLTAKSTKIWNIAPPGHILSVYLKNVFQEPSVTERSNQEMVDRSVFDGVPDILREGTTKGEKKIRYMLKIKILNHRRIHFYAFR